jgi:hypothetical protein
MIGLRAAMVMGPVLLLLPELTIWIILVVGFPGGILSANLHMSKLAWAVSLLSLLLLVPCAANLMWTQRRRACRASCRWRWVSCCLLCW